MSAYLGIDYGTRRLGLAVASSSLSTPLPSLPNNPALFSQITSLVKEYSITAIVVGLPDGSLQAEIQTFAASLARLTGLKVHLHDETLTTHEALVALRLTGAKRRKLQNEHSYAAALLLDDYLDMLH